MDKLQSSIRFLQNMLLCVALVFSTIFVVSCGDDNDDLKITDNTENSIDPTNTPMPEAVDLGLSVKWASCNLGASKPEEYGDYYGWGCTEPYAEGEIRTWTIYFRKMGGTGTKWGDCGTSKDPLRDYVYPNDKSIAGTQYDAAHVKLGGNWRLPTYSEIIELRDNTTTELTKQNDIYGVKVTSNVNGNSIFLPADICYNSSENNIDGPSGYYWGANVSSVYASYAYYFSFYYTDFDWSDGNRVAGFPIRPVTN